MQTSLFFIEFGAKHGIDLSNTFLLEPYLLDRYFSSNSKSWHESLKNRPSFIEHKYV